MIYKYKLIKEKGNDILYLYFDSNYEFSKSLLDKSSKNDSFKKKISNYIKDKNIPFKKGKVLLIVGGLLIGSFMLNDYPPNHKSYSNVSDNQLYAKQVDNATYTVQSGDTLTSIAQKYNLTVNDLKTINDLTNNNIKIGQILKVKTIAKNSEILITSESSAPEVPKVTSPEVKNTTYTVQKGDTLTSIAQKYNLTVNDLKTINNLTNDNIKIGQVLKLETIKKNEVQETPKVTASPEASKIPEVTTPEENTDTSKNMVTVYRSTGVILQIDFEEYIVGVVAAEMPASFNIEALKAQALIARTYALRKISKNEILTDTVSTQAYIDISQMKTKWGSSFNTYYKKISDAVKATAREFITYNGAYIDAVYHSTSNGYTEDAVNVWGNNIPYLKSVSSVWDQNASSYLRTETKEFDALINILGFQIDENTNIEILSRNNSGRVSSIRIDENTYTGVRLRTLLGLRSADFDIEIVDGKVEFLTRGYGHGVGMSQYGANGMANEGYTYKQIINHYYTGVTINKV